MKVNVLEKRTKKFAIDVVKFLDLLPVKPAIKVIVNQLARSATSVMANYRACCRAKSRKDFIYKMFIVQEEADESACWLELLRETGMTNTWKLTELIRDAKK